MGTLQQPCYELCLGGPARPICFKATITPMRLYGQQPYCCRGRASTPTAFRQWTPRPTRSDASTHSGSRNPQASDNNMRRNLKLSLSDHLYSQKLRGCDVQIPSAGRHHSPQYKNLPWGFSPACYLRPTNRSTHDPRALDAPTLGDEMRPGDMLSHLKCSLSAQRCPASDPSVFRRSTAPNNPAGLIVFRVRLEASSPDVIRCIVSGPHPIAERLC